MSVLNHDLVYEAQAARPQIETWVIRVATIVACLLLVLACTSLYGAIKANDRSISVYSVTEKGDAFQLPFYRDAAEAQAAAAVIDATAVPTLKLMSHIRSGP